MMTFNAVRNAKDCAAYFAEKDNYYLSDEAKYLPHWMGKGAKELGLQGVIDQTQFERLLEGILPNGQVIGLQRNGEYNHRAGFDITFSAPKTVSLLALLVGDKRFLEIHDRAVVMTVNEIERFCAQARTVGEDGKTVFENTENLVAALFPHDTSRSLDPQLHTHVVIANMTKRLDGQWRALASNRAKSGEVVQGFYERIYDYQLYFSSIYRSEIAKELKGLGVELRPAGEHGQFEIKGIPKDLIEFFSKRRAEVLTSIDTLGFDTPKARDIAALNTRQAKRPISREELSAFWKDQMQQSGYSLEFLEKFAKLLDAEPSKDDLTNSENRIKQDKENILVQAFNDAIEHISGNRVSITHPRLVAQTLEYSLTMGGSGNYDDLLKVLEQAIESKTIIPLNQERTLYTTAKLLQDESDLISLAERGLYKPQPIQKDVQQDAQNLKEPNSNGAHAIDYQIHFDEMSFNNFFNSSQEREEEKENPIELSTQQEIQQKTKQEKLLHDLLTTKDRISIVDYVGDRGGDKVGDKRDPLNSTFLTAFLNSAEQENKTVRILMPNKTQANAINDYVERKPQGLWQHLIAWGKPEVGESVAGFLFKSKHAKTGLFDKIANKAGEMTGSAGKNVILVHQAQQLSNDDLKELLTLTEKDRAKVILFNDQRSQKGFFAGNPLSVLRKTSVQTFKFSSSSFNKDTDQNNDHELGEQANTQLKFTFVDSQNTADTLIKKNRQQALVADYLKLTPIERQYAKIIVSNKQSVEELAQPIREGLKEQRELSYLEQAITTYQPVYLKRTEQRYATSYEKGMIVRFYDDQGRAQDWQVEKIPRGVNVLTLINEHGEQVKWNPQGNERNERSGIGDAGVRDANSNKEIRVFKPKTIFLAEGEKVKFNAALKDYKIKNGQGFTVEKIMPNHVVLKEFNTAKSSDGRRNEHTKRIRIPTTQLEKSAVDYNYATTLSKADFVQSSSSFISTTVFKHRDIQRRVFIEAKTQSLTKENIYELSKRIPLVGEVRLYTDHAEAAQKRFESAYQERTHEKETSKSKTNKISVIDRLLESAHASKSPSHAANNEQNEQNEKNKQNEKNDLTKTTISHVDRLRESLEENSALKDSLHQSLRGDIESAIAVLVSDSKQFKESESLAAKDPIRIAEKAVNFAIEKLSERDAGFKHTSLVIEALEYAIESGISLSELKTVLDQKEASGELVMGQYYSDGTRWTTKEAIDLEKSIITNVQDGKGTENALIDKEEALRYLNDSALTSDQKNACYFLASTKDRFVMVQGYAGTGKSTMLGALQSMMVESSDTPKKLYGLAPTHQAVKELKDKNINAQTLKSFIHELEKNPRDLSNTVLVLDEASMVSNRDFDQFLHLTEKNHGRAILMGDRAQHLSIESGKPFELLQQSHSIKYVLLKKDIVRQKNEDLKQAVIDTIHGQYRKSLNRIESKDPKESIGRIQDDTHLSILSSLPLLPNRSVVSEKDTKKLKEQLVLDYLTRTKEVRENTFVIVHAHEDRKDINELIRRGLKDYGEIDRVGYTTTQLISKNCTQAEYKDIHTYESGQILKVDNHYLLVDAVDYKNNIVLLKDEQQKITVLQPDQFNRINKLQSKAKQNRGGIELYEVRTAELTVGDRVRLTKTDKERGLFTHIEYQVESLTGTKKETKAVFRPVQKEKIGSGVSDGVNSGIKNNQFNKIELDLKEYRDCHWDYAYTVTGYTAQGATKDYVIDYEASFRRNLTNQRGFYIAQSRAKHHVMVYTDDKEKFISRVESNPANKYSALELIDGIPQSKESDELIAQSSHLKTYGQQDQNVKKAAYLDAKQIEHSLANQAERIIEGLLGAPNQQLSNEANWRYGKKGSLSIRMDEEHKGQWHSFETGETGNILGLIQRELNLDFKAVLVYANTLLGNGRKTQAIEQSQTKQTKQTKQTEQRWIEKNTSQPGDVKKTKRNSKTLDYAKQLLCESKPIEGTLAEKYLKEHRGIESIDADNLYFHPNVYAGQIRRMSQEGQKEREVKSDKPIYYPALLAVGKDREGQVQCTQVIYLDPKTGNKADLDIKKRTYGSPSSASVRLELCNDKGQSDEQKPSKQSGITFIAEGLETGLSIRDAISAQSDSRDKKGQDVLVTLGKSNFKHLDPNQLATTVVLCLDHDGKKTFTDPIIHESAQRLMQAGKDVYIAMPNDERGGEKSDFNDLARKEGHEAVAQRLEQAIPYETWQKESVKIQAIDKKEDFEKLARDLLEQDHQKMQRILENLSSKDIEFVKSNKQSIDQINKNALPEIADRMRNVEVERVIQETTKTTKNIEDIEREIY